MPCLFIFVKSIPMELLHSLSKLLAGLELSNLLGGNLDLLTGSGVHTLTGVLLLHFESTETNELNFLTSLQSFLYTFYCGVNGLLGSNL